MEQEEDGKQICLWAYSLTIKHPITKKEMVFEALQQVTGSWKILEETYLLNIAKEKNNEK